jgi:hypothetical protein
MNLEKYVRGFIKCCSVLWGIAGSLQAQTPVALAVLRNPPGLASLRERKRRLGVPGQTVPSGGQTVIPNHFNYESSL